MCLAIRPPTADVRPTLPSPRGSRITQTASLPTTVPLQTRPTMSHRMAAARTGTTSTTKPPRQRGDRKSVSAGVASGKSSLGEAVEVLQRFGEVPAPEAETEVVTRVPVHRAWEEHHALPLHEICREPRGGDIGEEAREAYAPHPRSLPLEGPAPLPEERVRMGQVVEHEAQVASQYLLFCAQRYQGEDLARGGVADGGVVLEGGHAPEEVQVPGGEPADAQAGQPEGLGHHPEAHRPLVQVRRRRQPVGGVVFQQTVHLVRED